MFVTGVIFILSLVSAANTATARVEHPTDFDYCKNNKSQWTCVEANHLMTKCSDQVSLEFYCQSASPIQVFIGRLEITSNKFPQTFNITSAASSQNGHNSHCIKIAAKASQGFFLQCRTNTNELLPPPWTAIDEQNYHPNRFMTELQYIKVQRADPSEICAHGSAVLARPSNLLYCHTWDMCAVLLTNWLTNQMDVTLVDIPLPSSCTTIWMPSLSERAEKWAKEYSRPGLLVFDVQNNKYLLPYSPLSPLSEQQPLDYTDTLVAFKITTYWDGRKLFMECKASMLYSCGVDVVAHNFSIKKSWSDCHRHVMTLKLIPSRGGEITCKAFNQFLGRWDQEYKVFSINNPKMPMENQTTETPNHAGINNVTRASVAKPTEIPHLVAESSTNKPNDTQPAETRNETLSPTLENTSSTSIGDAKESPVLTIAGALIGGIVICFLILLPLLIYQCKRIKRHKQRIRLTEEEICGFMEGMQMEKAKSKGTIHNVFVLPYDRNLEVSKIAVDFKTTILGSGAFGKVLKGRYRGRDVAIKTIDSTTLNVDAFRCLLSELKIMSYLGKHEHVVELVGAITSDIKRGEVFLILEYCAHGSALTYIREHRDDFISFLSDDKTTYLPTLSIKMGGGWELSSEHLLRWSYEVACGMEYVSSQNIYHGDLAARNILLTENLTVKVGDFGLSRQLDMEKYTCYVQNKDCPLPLKWMALESLRDLKFSIQSDVWSFGVTMWELFGLGTTPYPGMIWNRESWKSLCDGVRLERPEFASFDIYNNIMRKCWNEDPKLRPNFFALQTLLEHELEVFNSAETCKIQTRRKTNEEDTKWMNPNNSVV